jgi:hypothetical protein
MHHQFDLREIAAVLLPINENGRGNQRPKRTFLNIESSVRLTSSSPVERRQRRWQRAATAGLKLEFTKEVCLYAFIAAIYD